MKGQLYDKCPFHREGRWKELPSELVPKITSHLTPLDLSQVFTGLTLSTSRQRKEWFQGQVAIHYRQVAEIMAMVPFLEVGTPPASHPDEYSVRKWELLTRLLNQETAFSTFGGMMGEGDDNLHFSEPLGVAVDPDGLVYVSDPGNFRCQAFDKAGHYVGTIGGNGVGNQNNQFDQPQSVSVDSHFVYVADIWNHRIQMFNKSEGTYHRTIGINGPGRGNDQFNSPHNVAVEPGEDGHLYVSDLENHRVQVLSKDGTFIRTFVGNGPGDQDDQLKGPHSVAIEPREYGRVFVADTRNHRVQVFSQDGNHVHTIGGNGEGIGNDQLRYPSDLAISPTGEIYVADSGNFRVQVFSNEGVYLRTIGNALHGLPYQATSTDIGSLGGICIDKGLLYVVDTELCRIQLFLILQ